MAEVTRSRVAPLVIASLGEECLDPAVRDLAIERLEAHLLTAIIALPFAASTVRVTLSATDGAVSLCPALDLLKDEGAALRERIDRTLLARLSPTVGAARLAVRNGERAMPRPSDRPAARPTPASPVRWEDVVSALVRVIALQQEQIEALARRLEVAPTDGEILLELHRIEAMIARAKGP